VSGERLKLTTYFGERDPAGGGFLADALVATYARHGVELSALFRGIEGFGLAHGLHSDRLLTSAEDLPIVAVAVDRRERIEALVPEVEHLGEHGLVTLERPRAPAPGEDGKLTVYLGRRARAGGRPAHEAVVDVLRSHGAAGATVLFGVDGTIAGERRQARFFGANADVPLMVIGVGTRESIVAAGAEIGALVPGAVRTLETVRLGRPPDDSARLEKLMVHSGEHDLHDRLIARLREAGGRGATALRGIWGFRGGRAPHGDAFWALRRRVPVLVVVVDTPERIATAYAIADELGDGDALLTTEPVEPV
jgi:PII-like signaling protein